MTDRATDLKADKRKNEICARGENNCSWEREINLIKKQTVKRSNRHTDRHQEKYGLCKRFCARGENMYIFGNAKLISKWNGRQTNRATGRATELLCAQGKQVYSGTRNE